ncbi:6-pyruvoyl tetrahydropterin synthase family protein [Amycolatopsis sp. NPDC058986]|uniref:6-pyruvoyl trahydropterin synthase family protein n=1 Tax=unclassified Amycolatopsis TaxID=2618356 RepID=UPI00366A9002
MRGTATTGQSVTSPMEIATGDRAPAVHQITIEHTFETAHRLPQLGGKCTSLHGHSWRAAVSVVASGLSDESIVVEFGRLKAGIRGWIDTYLDHSTMLGIRDPLVVHLAAAKCKVFRFGANRNATVDDAELMVSDLAWPTVEAVAVLLRRVSQAVLAGLPGGEGAQVGRVTVRETDINAAAYGSVIA